MCQAPGEALQSPQLPLKTGVQRSQASYQPSHCSRGRMSNTSSFWKTLLLPSPSSCPTLFESWYYTHVSCKDPSWRSSGNPSDLPVVKGNSSLHLPRAAWRIKSSKSMFAQPGTQKALYNYNLEILFPPSERPRLLSHPQMLPLLRFLTGDFSEDWVHIRPYPGFTCPREESSAHAGWIGRQHWHLAN